MSTTILAMPLTGSKPRARTRQPRRRSPTPSTCRRTSLPGGDTGRNPRRRTRTPGAPQEADVKRAGESGAYRDFHALNYLQYAYLQLGRFRDAKRVTGLIEAQYGALSNKTTAPDTPDLQARHVRGRTIYALPDRVVYGYFDILTRFMVESGDWNAVTTVPLVAPSRDFRAMKLQLEAMAAAKRGDPATAKTAADELERLASEPGQHPLAQMIITLQAKEAQAVAAHAAGDEPRVIAMMTNAVEIEDSIEALSQPPYPIIPAHELYGTLLMELRRPAEAAKHFAEALKRTPGRPMAVYGIARAAEVRGDRSTAVARYTEFLELWKQADQDRPELAIDRKSTRLNSSHSQISYAVFCLKKKNDEVRTLSARLDSIEP